MIKSISDLSGNVNDQASVLPRAAAATRKCRLPRKNGLIREDANGVGAYAAIMVRTNGATAGGVMCGSSAIGTVGRRTHSPRTGTPVMQ